ncbi:MAG: NUDIX domain-containing protein [Rhodanobacter sp.]
MAAIPLLCTMASVVTLRGGGSDARVLLVHRAGPTLAGAWSYVAGHLEEGEFLWQCALRELAEETSLRPLALYATDKCEEFYDVVGECIQVVPAFLAVVADDATVQLNGEHDAFRWVSVLEAVNGLPFGGQRELFAHVQREFIERTPSAWLRMPM